MAAQRGPTATLHSNVGRNIICAGLVNVDGRKAEMRAPVYLDREDRERSGAMKARICRQKRVSMGLPR